MHPRLHSSNFYNRQPKASAWLLNKPIKPNPAKHCGKGPQEEEGEGAKARGEGSTATTSSYNFIFSSSAFSRGNTTSSRSNIQLKTFPSFLEGRVLTPHPQPCSFPQSHQVILLLFYQATSNPRLHITCQFSPKAPTALMNSQFLSSQTSSEMQHKADKVALLQIITLYCSLSIQHLTLTNQDPSAEPWKPGLALLRPRSVT